MIESGILTVDGIGWINFNPEQQEMWAERKSISINLYCNCMSSMNLIVFFWGGEPIVLPRFVKALAGT